MKIFASFSLTVLLTISYTQAFVAQGRTKLHPLSTKHYQQQQDTVPLFSSSALASAASTDPSATVPPNYEDKTVAWTKARFHNTPLFRSGSVLLAIGLAGYTATPTSAGGAALFQLSSKVAAATHVFSYSTWFGSMAYTTFVLGLTMFKNLPRKAFGKLQAKLFPKYFKIGAVSILLQFFTLPSIPMFAGTTTAMKKALVLSFVATLFNLFYLEPTSTEIMLERYALEDIAGGTGSDKYKSLQKSFGKFHGISSLANLIAFCGAVAHGIYIASVLAA